MIPPSGERNFFQWHPVSSATPRCNYDIRICGNYFTCLDLFAGLPYELASRCFDEFCHPAPRSNQGLSPFFAKDLGNCPAINAGTHKLHLLAQYRQ
ncbi:MAG TPA: hypothetical protein VFI95_11125 [Terriglobales bacterium]|nr:hypothetical protein [Terriglobales bacterium]